MVSAKDSGMVRREKPVPASGLGFRIDHKRLARVCHNVASGLHAGVDIRRIWATEAERGSSYHRARMAQIRDRVAVGDTLREAMQTTGNYFPPLVCELVDVGERTGRLERIFFRLAEHYDSMVRLQRAFLAGIAWPMIELMLGLGVIGAFILITGIITGGQGPPPITFFGLYGVSGFLIYCSVIGTVVALVAASLFGLKHGWLKLDPLFRLAMHVPGIGKGLQTMALSRLTWSLAMAADSDIDARRTVELALRTTGNSYYTDHIEGIKRSIRSGNDMHLAFRHTGAFPDDFLDTLQTGEIGGRISEAMEVLAKEYEDRAKNYYRVLAVAAGIGVFLLTAGFIIYLIFHLALQYLGILNSALEM